MPASCAGRLVSSQAPNRPAQPTGGRFPVRSTREADQRRLFFQAGVAFGCGEQVVVEGNGCLHGSEEWAAHIMASVAAYMDAQA
jgi:hypothetical protein